MLDPASCAVQAQLNEHGLEMLEPNGSRNPRHGNCGIGSLDDCGARHGRVIWCMDLVQHHASRGTARIRSPQFSTSSRSFLRITLPVAVRGSDLR